MLVLARRRVLGERSIARPVHRSRADEHVARAVVEAQRVEHRLHVRRRVGGHVDDRVEALARERAPTRRVAPIGAVPAADARRRRRTDAAREDGHVPTARDELLGHRPPDELRPAQHEHAHGSPFPRQRSRPMVAYRERERCAPDASFVAEIRRNSSSELLCERENGNPASGRRHTAWSATCIRTPVGPKRENAANFSQNLPRTAVPARRSKPHRVLRAM